MIQYLPLPFTTATERSRLWIDCDGVVRACQTRVTLDTVTGTYKERTSAGGILDQYPSLDVADIYATIAYYLRHRQDVDDYLGQRDQQAERIRRESVLPSRTW